MIDWEECFSVRTDGASSMMGCRNESVSHVKNFEDFDSDFPIKIIAVCRIQFKLGWPKTVLTNPNPNSNLNPNPKLTL